MAADGADVKALNARPLVRAELFHVWEAHKALAGDRAESGRTSFMAIDRYAQRYGIDELPGFERFHRLLLAMDEEIALWLAERAEDEERRRRDGSNA